MKDRENKTSKKAVFFSFGQLADLTAYQTFTFLVFTFYYAVVGINIVLISIGFIIWSVWNSLNDPMGTANAIYNGWISSFSHNHAFYFFASNSFWIN
ncbi:MAG: hypothetical protein ACTSRI_18255 [Promethearchaeota archaeon]